MVVLRILFLALLLHPGLALGGSRCAVPEAPAPTAAHKEASSCCTVVRRCDEPVRSCAAPETRKAGCPFCKCSDRNSPLPFVPAEEMVLKGEERPAASPGPCAWTHHPELDARAWRVNRSLAAHPATPRRSMLCIWLN